MVNPKKVNITVILKAKALLSPLCWTLCHKNITEAGKFLRGLHIPPPDFKGYFNERRSTQFFLLYCSKVWKSALLLSFELDWISLEALIQYFIHCYQNICNITIFREQRVFFTRAKIWIYHFLGKKNARLTNRANFHYASTRLIESCVAYL